MHERWFISGNKQWGVVEGTEKRTSIHPLRMEVVLATLRRVLDS